MLAKTYTGSIQGVEGLVVRVEVDLTNGITSFRTVGLPDTSVREAEVRVRSAMLNSGFSFPQCRITVNLAPADVRKQGTAYDLAVALGIVAAMREGPVERLTTTLFLGELALDGSLRPVRGVLPIVAEASRRGLARVVVPEENGAEAALVKEISAYSVRSLREAVDLLDQEWKAPLPVGRPNGSHGPKGPNDPNEPNEQALLDLSDVKGQRQAKRALEISAAGGHNLLMVGPPGAGKSLLAMRLPSLLPALGFEEALEVTKIYSVAGLLDEGGLVSRPPFRAPHHTISAAAMVGGGGRNLPGEVSLAHHGVLFLDELPEFPRPALEALRQPMEDGRVRVRRVGSIISLPARFTLIAAMNPCPCGFRGATTRPCACTPGTIQRYQGRLSGPLLDRIDLKVAVRALRPEEMLAPPTGEASGDARPRIVKARKIQSARFRRSVGRKEKLNASMTPASVARHCELDAAGRANLEAAIGRLGLSARGFHRVLKVARTIADLVGAERIEPVHLQEAIHFRSEVRCETILG
jgi:magnesium chelatase family protein